MAETVSSSALWQTRFLTSINQLSKAEFVFGDSIYTLQAYGLSSQQNLWYDYKSEVLTPCFPLIKYVAFSNMYFLQ